MRLTFDDCMVMHSAAPFAVQGVSVYASTTTPIVYREQRLDFGLSLGADPELTKTARVGFTASPDDEVGIVLDPSWYPGTVYVNVRQCADNVENESIVEQQIELDASGDTVSEILGTATLLSVQARDGGVCIISFSWEPSLQGIQPTSFTLIRTAGPSSPANISVTVVSGRQIVSITTLALLDSSGYTFKVQAANGATTLDVLTGISVQADATGPVAPTTLTLTEW